MPKRHRYQDFIEEQLAGRFHGVFIDDTGSPGLQNTSPNLHSDRKTWVAVVVPRTVIGEVWEQFPRALAEFQSQLGATEFHTAHVYGGTGSFKGVPLAVRLGLLGFMAQLFEAYRFPVFVQTLDPESLEDVLARAKFPERLGPFNLRRQSDLALFFLLLRVKWHLEQHYADTERCASVFVDEGFQRNGAAIVIPTFRSVFADGMICFGRSDAILPIQLADFAAFCLNRSQLLLGREMLSDLDKSFLSVIEPITWNFQNIPRVNADEWWPGGDRLAL